MGRHWMSGITQGEWDKMTEDERRAVLDQIPNGDNQD